MTMTLENFETEGKPTSHRSTRSWDNAVRTGRGPYLFQRCAALVSLSVAVLVFGILSDSTMRYALVIGIIYAIALIGNNAITGLLGEINIGTGAVMAIGAYTVVYLLNNGVDLEIALAGSVLLTAIVGLVLAIPTVRLEGIFTALVTFALAFAIPDLIVQLDTITGGHSGTPVPFGESLFGVPVSPSDNGWFTLVLIIFTVLALLSLFLLHRRTGRLLVTIGEAGPAAECFGLRSRWWKVAVWTFAAAHAGMAGALFGLTVGFLTPDVFPVFLSIILLVGTVVGGARSPIGALFGGIFVGTIPPQIQNFVPPESTGMLFGLALFVMLLAGGKGAGGLLELGATKLAKLRTNRQDTR